MVNNRKTCCVLIKLINSTVHSTLSIGNILPTKNGESQWIDELIVFSSAPLFYSVIVEYLE